MASLKSAPVASELCLHAICNLKRTLLARTARQEAAAVMSSVAQLLRGRPEQHACLCPQLC